MEKPDEISLRPVKELPERVNPGAVDGINMEDKKTVVNSEENNSLEDRHGPTKVDLPEYNTSVHCPSAVHGLLRPLLICLSIFGLYFPSTWKDRSLRKWSALKIYCTAFVGILVAGIVYYTYINCVKLTEFGPNFVYHILAYLYRVCNVIAAIVMSASCYRKDGLDSILKQWARLDQSILCSIDGRRSFLRMAIAVCSISLILFTSSFVILMVLTFSNGENTQFKSASDVTSFLWTLMDEIANYGAWLLPMTLLCIISLGLAFEFCAFNEQFKVAIQSQSKLSGDFERYRKRHQSICNLVEAVDDMFCVFFGSALAINVVAILLKFYLILRHPTFFSNPAAQASMALWLTNSLSFVTATCFCGSLLNHKAHTALSYVHDCDLTKNMDISLQIQVFLARLTGERIGFTALKLFVIDKAAILTVLGVLSTYYVILDQFQKTAPSCNADITSTNITM